jgi:hypothetical protein|nr:hypothetical protein [uncultured Flavobacterium sp.]
MKTSVYTFLVLICLTVSCTSTDETFKQDPSNEKLKGISFDSKTTFYDFITLSKENVNFESDLNLLDYINLNDNFNIKDYKKNIELHKLNNDNDVMYSLEMINKKYFTNCYIIYDKKHNKFTTYFINIKKDEYIEVFNKDKQFIYTSINVNGFVKLTYEKKSNSNLYKETCFSSCMDYAEEQITDNLIGWVAWETNPAVKIVAAYGCDKTCNPRLGI